MKRYKHNLSHYHLFTGNMGELIPAGCVEVLPNDTFRMSTSVLVRCEPLVAPVMHPVSIRVHQFFAPNRILWSGWEKFITEADPDTPPPTTSASGATQRLSNYLGIPRVGFTSVSSLPFRAYNKIWNEYYRDQEIDSELTLDQKELQHCAWEKDYATAARTDSQRGADAAALVVDNQVQARTMRQALALQRFREARSRFGNRYVEYLQYLGVNPSDARLQRPEYLGGGRATVNFSEVLQTAPSADDGVVGSLKGHGIAAVRTPPIEKWFEEHGFLITLISVRPKAIYTRGLHKKWKRTLAQSYWQKERELEGQQAMAKHEVAANGDAADDELFGWQDHDYSYRTEVSRVSGQFATSTKDFWHLSRDFTLQPELNSDFIKCEPSRRIFADQVADGLLFAAQHNIAARRLVRRRTAPRTV